MAGRLRILLIQPSHYDAEGYVIQWWRTFTPGHVMMVINGILADAAGRGALGADVTIERRVIDEPTEVVRHRREIAWLRGAKRAAVFLTGVQTSQYPRAVDLARPFIAAGIPVVMGGFHVSGVLALTPDWDAGLRDAREAGIALYAGELEEGIDELLGDLWRGEVKPLYNHLADTPALDQAPLPDLDLPTVRHTVRHLAGMDLGRGCPYLCSFCTIINVHGRRMRERTVEGMRNYVKANWANGIRHYFITDDNFARNPQWEPLLDELIRLREEEGIALDILIQVDVRAASIPRFVEKTLRAGCGRIFLGIESLREDNLESVHKKQNKKVEINRMILTWKRAGAIIYPGFIFGLPNDDRKRVMEDLELIKNHLAVDIAAFAVLTPYPGCKDQQMMLAAGVEMDPDFNRYDTEHVVVDLPNHSRAEWQAIYHEVWRSYYSFEHMETVLKRAMVSDLPVKEVFKSLLGYSVGSQLDAILPLGGGLGRRRVRTDRRPGLPIVPAWRFYPAQWWGTARYYARLSVHMARMYRTLWRAKREVARHGYTDEALAPVSHEGEA
ncbi:B12-binding domain-containing radical SAM protein [Endothiovibrio diazotrophicus]